ncbi:MAG: hypothetical protein JJ902_23325, partial [Roseibium sp.]|nr:hypothetical protein [Roseibium sp.]
DMDANVDAWQWHMMIPQFCQGLARWTQEAVNLVTASAEPFGTDWTPPRRPLVDPTREIPAMRDEVKAGFSSRRQKIRQLGFDPEKVEAEIRDERADAARDGLVFDSDAYSGKAAGEGSDGSQEVD